MKSKMFIISCLLLAVLTLFSSCGAQTSPAGTTLPPADTPTPTPSPAVETPTPVETPDAYKPFRTGVPADWADCENIDAKSGTAYYGALKSNYVDFTSEPVCLYRYEGIYSAVEGAESEFDGESIYLHSQEGPYYNPTATPRPVDSEEHFNYLKTLISSLAESDEKVDGANDRAFVLTLEKDGKDVAKYFFNSDGTVEIKRGDKTTYSTVDNETIMFIALLSSIYVPYGSWGSAMLQSRQTLEEMISIEYQLEVSFGGKTKTYDAEGAVALAAEYFGFGAESMKFYPIINVEYDFSGGGFITFRETYKRGGTDYEKIFYLGSDGRFYNDTNALPDQHVFLTDGTYRLLYCGHAYRVNRSRDSFDYAAVKALIENTEA